MIRDSIKMLLIAVAVVGTTLTLAFGGLISLAWIVVVVRDLFL